MESSFFRARNPSKSPAIFLKQNNARHALLSKAKRENFASYELENIHYHTANIYITAYLNGEALANDNRYACQYCMTL